MRTKILLAVLVVLTAWVVAQPDEYDMLGVLNGNDYSVEITRVVWFPRMGVPQPMETPGWAVQPGEVDSFLFDEKVNDPFTAIINYNIDTLSLQYTITDIDQDSWYELPVDDPRPAALPQVRLQEYVVGISGEPRTRLPAALSLVSNPARGRAAFRYAGPAGTLAVYAGDGRLVRTLNPGANPRGETVEWDGTDRRGVKLPTGVYYCRALAEPGSPGVRFVLIGE